MLIKFLKIMIFIIAQKQGFFYGLKLKMEKTSPKQLYSKYAIKVMPGEYLSLW